MADFDAGTYNITLPGRGGFISGLDREVAARIAAGTQKELKEALLKYIKERGNPNQKMRKKLTTLNKKTALAAQKAMVQKYASSVSGAPSYRVGDPGVTGRYSGGKLLQALNASANVSFGTTTMSFFNMDFMDSAAPQWNRLSFGAGTGANNQVTPMKSPTNGATLSPDHIITTQGGESFSIPGSGTGAWYLLRGGGGGRELHVTRRSNKQGFAAASPRSRFKLMPPSGGHTIQPMGFVQAGVSEAHRMYPTLLIRAVRTYLTPGSPGHNVGPI